MMAQINQDHPQGEGEGPVLLVAEGGRETPEPGARTRAL